MRGFDPAQLMCALRDRCCAGGRRRHLGGRGRHGPAGLVRAGARVGAARQAHLMLAIGSALAALTTAVALVGVLTFAEPLGAPPGRRAPTSRSAIGIGAAISAAVMCAGLLRLPWAAGTAADRRPAPARRAGDRVRALVRRLGAGLPADRRSSAPRPRAPCVGILIAAGAAALAVGIVVIVAMRGAGSRLRLLLMGCGAISVAACGVGLTAGLCQAGPGLATLSGVVMPIGADGRRVRRAAAATPRRSPSST